MQMISRSYKVLAHSPLDVIALEECLVNSVRTQDATLLLYVNSPSVIIGRNQNYWREVSPACGLPVYRRVSGGGAVYHDQGNVNWALVVPRALHSQDEELAMVAKALETLGIHAFPGARGGLFVAMGNGETVGKISGTARRFGTFNVLHHGTLLVRADIEALKASLGGIKVFEDFSIASVPAHPINISSIDSSITTTTVIDALSSELAGMPPRVLDLARLWSAPTSSEETRQRYDPEVLNDEIDLCIDQDEFVEFKREFGSNDWIRGRSPQFSFTVSDGKGSAVVKVHEGKIGEAVALETGDRASEEYASRIAARYAGINFDFSVPEIMEKEQVWMNSPR